SNNNNNDNVYTYHVYSHVLFLLTYLKCLLSLFN
ncbi:Uncharacterized protein BM_BM506, partial [Brugia malayi]